FILSRAFDRSRYTPRLPGFRAAGCGPHNTSSAFGLSRAMSELGDARSWLFRLPSLPYAARLPPTQQVPSIAPYEWMPPSYDHRPTYKTPTRNNAGRVQKNFLVRRPPPFDASRVREPPPPPVSRDGPGRVMTDSTNSKIDTACRLLAGPSINRRS